MIAGLLPGQTGINFANEVADAALDAASLITACHYTNGPKDKLQHGDAPVTCKECAREMNR